MFLLRNLMGHTVKGSYRQICKRSAEQDWNVTLVKVRALAVVISLLLMPFGLHQQTKTIVFRLSSGTSTKTDSTPKTVRIRSGSKMVSGVPSATTAPRLIT